MQREMPPARGLWASYQVAAGKADKGGQGGALVATLFFLGLNDGFLAFGHVFNVDAAFWGLAEYSWRFLCGGEKAVALRTEISRKRLQG